MYIPISDFLSKFIHQWSKLVKKVLFETTKASVMLDKCKNMYYNKSVIAKIHEKGDNFLNSIQLAEYIINYALDNSSPVSNLQLQKILYFLNGEFYRATGKFLIESCFYAYPLGPVEENVYNIYKAYGASKISSANNVDLPVAPEERQLINDILRKYVKNTATELVTKSHQPNGSWYKTKTQIGLYNIIPKALIEQEFTAAFS